MQSAVATPIYTTQCQNGHVLEVVPGTELEDRCKAYAARDLGDVLPLDQGECPACLAERRKANAALITSMAGLTCWEHPEDGCPEDCESTMVDDIPDSIYDHQVRSWV